MFVASLIRRLNDNHPNAHRFDEDRYMKTKKTLERTVTGIIVPRRWDSKGNVTGISIQAFDESEYIVKEYKRGKELFDFIHEKVEVTGKVFEQLDRKDLIEVKRFEVLEIHNSV